MQFFRCDCGDYYNSNGTFFKELPPESDGTYLRACCEVCYEKADKELLRAWNPGPLIAVVFALLLAAFVGLLVLINQ